jgi:hypothetical protein
MRLAPLGWEILSVMGQKLAEVGYLWVRNFHGCFLKFIEAAI